MCAVSEYNKSLCDERQIHRNNEIEAIRKVQEAHAETLSELEVAVLILTTLAKTEKMWKWVVISLAMVIVALAFGKEIAAVFIGKLIP